MMTSWALDAGDGDFSACAAENGCTTLVDVRRFPGVEAADPQFWAGQAVCPALHEAGIRACGGRVWAGKRTAKKDASIRAGGTRAFGATRTICRRRLWIVEVDG